MATNLNFLTIAEAARHIRARDIAAVELVDHLLARIEALDPQINTFIKVTTELAWRQAKAADAEIAHGRLRGPMNGIPVGLKDICSTAGILTSGHSKVGMDNPPTQDATSVAKLYEAGAVLKGKLSTHEFAHGGPSFDLPWPPARNPWDPSRSAGGSPSGSAAAVAAGFVLGAMGSDAGGSPRWTMLSRTVWPSVMKAMMAGFAQDRVASRCSFTAAPEASASPPSTCGTS